MCSDSLLLQYHHGSSSSEPVNIECTSDTEQYALNSKQNQRDKAGVVAKAHTLGHVWC